MEKLLKIIIVFILGASFWYGIFSFIMWEPNAFAWHWGVRLVYSLFAFNAFRTACED